MNDIGIERPTSACRRGRTHADGVSASQEVVGRNALGRTAPRARTRKTSPHRRNFPTRGSRLRLHLLDSYPLLRRSGNARQTVALTRRRHLRLPPKGLPVMFVNEDTNALRARHHPALYTRQSARARGRSACADTVGQHARRRARGGAIRQRIIEDRRGAARWPGHKDRGLGVINSVAPPSRRATSARLRDRVGERVGKHADGSTARQPQADGLARTTVAPARLLLDWRGLVRWTIPPTTRFRPRAFRTARLPPRRHQIFRKGDDDWPTSSTGLPPAVRLDTDHRVAPMRQSRHLLLESAPRANATRHPSRPARARTSSTKTEVRQIVWTGKETHHEREERIFATRNATHAGGTRGRPTRMSRQQQ